MANLTFSIQIKHTLFTQPEFRKLNRIWQRTIRPYRARIVRLIAKEVRRTAPRDSNKLRRNVRVKSLVNKQGLQISRVRVEVFYASFTTRGPNSRGNRGWFGLVDNRPELLDFVDPILHEMNNALIADMRLVYQAYLNTIKF